MRGNSHVRFLGGRAAAMPPGYPTKSERHSVIERIEVECKYHQLNITSRESGLTSIWSPITRELD